MSTKPINTDSEATPPETDADAAAALDPVGAETGAAKAAREAGATPETHVRLVRKTGRDPVSQIGVEGETTYLAKEPPYDRMITVDGQTYENAGVEDGFTTYRQPDF